MVLVAVYDANVLYGNEVRDLLIMFAQSAWRENACGSGLDRPGDLID